MEEISTTWPGAKKHKCGQCSYSTDHAGGMKRHQSTHTGDNPFKCTTCRKAFTQSGHLQIHQRIHTKEKPYKCTTCGKAFTQSGNLQTHQRIHTREKPYKCTTCGKAFTQSGNLKKHQKTHTGDQPSTFSLGEEKFANSAAENKHEKRHKEKVKSICETTALSTSLIKQEPEEISSFGTWSGVQVKCEDVEVKCENAKLSFEEVERENKDLTPGPNLQVDGRSVKQEGNSDAEAERGDPQEFVVVEVWVDFLNEAEQGRPACVSEVWEDAKPGARDTESQWP